MNIMKVRISLKRLIWPLIAMIFVAGLIVFGFTFHFFLFEFPYDWRQYTIIGLYVLASIALILAVKFATSYEITKSSVTFNKGTQKVVYYYGDVVYIDEEKSEKKKMVHFYTRQGHCRYLYFDNQNFLYKTMLTYCKNRLSKEEFEKKYPEVKL